MESYHQLLLGHAKPTDSILAPLHMSPLTALAPSIRRRHFVVALVSLVSLLTEFLPITLANIPFSDTQIKEAYDICNYIAMAILFLMLVSLTILIFRRRYNLRDLPRLPTTLASILLYITNSGGEEGWNMMNSLQGLSTVSAKERDARIMGYGKLYAMGLVESGDLRIDEDDRICRDWTRHDRKQYADSNFRPMA